MSEKKNFEVRTSESLYFVVYYKDAAGAPIDLTTYSVDMDVVDADDASIATNLAAPSDAVNGEITVTNLDCSAWPVGTLYYDLIVTDGSSVKQSLLHGDITVVKGVSS